MKPFERFNSGVFFGSTLLVVIGTGLFGPIQSLGQPQMTPTQKSQEILTTQRLNALMKNIESGKMILDSEDQSMIVQSFDLPKTDPTVIAKPEDLNRAKFVIVINKSDVGSTAQTMKVYENGTLKYDWKVSTGREKLETAKSGKVYVTSTPEGYYHATRWTKLHKSITWDADMPHAIFFVGGVAIHASNAIQQLGKRASGGCVRLSPKNAKTLYTLLTQNGLKDVIAVKKDGQTRALKSGKPLYIRTLDAIIIVENKV